MTRASTTFKKRDVAKAYKAVIDAGGQVSRVESRRRANLSTTSRAARPHSPTGGHGTHDKDAYEGRDLNVVASDDAGILIHKGDG
jgi:hypothetical protein